MTVLHIKGYIPVMLKLSVPFGTVRMYEKLNVYNFHYLFPIAVSIITDNHDKQ